MKTEDFEFEATIDWIELEVITEEDSNFYALQLLFETNYVKPIKPKSGGATNTFNLKLHNVSSWKAVDGLIDRANYVKPLKSVYVIGIEISFDAFSILNNKNELIEKTAEFYWLLANPSSNNHRAAGIYKGSAEPLTSHSSTMRKIVNKQSIYIGSQKDDAISQRIYYKTTDNRRTLPIEQHRARYELILVGEACPFRTISEAKKYNFTKLVKWFKFRKLDENLGAFSLMLVKATKQLGKINMPRIAGGGLKINSFGTKADIVLNRIAYNKLRELSSRLNKKRVMQKLRVTHFINPL